MTVARVPLAEASALLQALFPEVPEGQRIQIWTLPDKASYWFAAADEAAAAALRMAKTHDVYVSGGLRRAGLGVDVRGKSDDVTGLAALWADFDVAGVAHAKKGLPQSMADVERILADLPLQPSAIVASGTGGVHAWWIFHEVWDLTPAGENAKAQALAYGWGETIRQAAKRLGFAFDSLADLARVLRVPGTFNHKGGTAKPVRLETLTDRRFNPSDFEPFVTARPAGQEGVVRLGNLVLSGDANPAIEKFEMLDSIDAKFRATWEGKRPNFASASEYDLSIATMAARAGWADQEIADLMIARRRKAGQDLKLREEYYARTILRARSSSSVQQAAAEITPEEVVTSESARKAALAEIEILTGLKVARIIARGEEKPDYLIVLEDGREVSLGDSDMFMKHSTWWKRSYEFTRKAPGGPEPKLARWRTALANIQGLIDLEEKNEASDEAGIVDLLRSYLGKIPDITKWQRDSIATVLRKHQPFRRGAEVCFALQPFQTHIGQMIRERYTRPRLITLLKKVGCRRVDEDIAELDGKSRIHRVYWRVPFSTIEGRVTEPQLDTPPTPLQDRTVNLLE